MNPPYLSKINCKPYVWLACGLAVFYFLSDYFERQVVFIGRKNLLLISIVPLVVSIYYKHLVTIYKQPLSFQAIVVSLLWVSALVAAFFLFIGISTPELRMTYILSQVLYLGGWIALYSLLPDTLLIHKSVKYISLIPLAVLLIAFIYFDTDFFDPHIIQYPKIVFVKSLSFPQVIIESIAVMVGIISLLLSISASRTDNGFGIIIIMIIILSRFLGAGHAFYNYMAYDYMFFAPFLLSTNIACLMFFVKRLKP